MGIYLTLHPPAGEADVGKNNMKHKFGIIGLIIAIIAITIAIYQNNLRSFLNLQSTTKTDQISQNEEPKKTIGFKFKEKKFEISFGKSKEIKSDSNPDEFPKDGIFFLYSFLGLISIILGVISWIQKEYIRISGSAISLGLIAIAWQYVLIAVVIAIVILIFANLNLG